MNRDINFTFRSNDVINDGREGYIKFSTFKENERKTRQGCNDQ